MVVKTIASGTVVPGYDKLVSTVVLVLASSLPSLTSIKFYVVVHARATCDVCKIM